MISLSGPYSPPLHRDRRVSIFEILNRNLQFLLEIRILHKKKVSLISNNFFPFVIDSAAVAQNAIYRTFREIKGNSGKQRVRIN